MTPWTLVLLALGVSADAFAVALGKGLQLRAHVLRTALVFGAAFGLAQAIMPLLGWLLGSAFAEAIAPFDHWISFGLLALVGGKMLWEALTPDAPADAQHPEHVHDTEAFTVREVVLLAVATSIDALAVGVSFAFLVPRRQRRRRRGGHRPRDLRPVVRGGVRGLPDRHALPPPGGD
ncbi:MAG: manganese efflux pump MntP family protein, partial [Microbacterium aurum]